MLGGVGAGMGVLNSVDIEALTKKVKNASHDAAEGIRLQAQWLPNTLTPQIGSLKYDKEFLTLFNRTQIKQLITTLVRLLIGQGVRCRHYISICNEIKLRVT